MSKKVSPGDRAWLFLAGAFAPLVATVAAVHEDGSVNLSVIGATGRPEARERVRLAKDADEGVGGDYALLADGLSAMDAQNAHTAAANKRGSGAPAATTGGPTSTDPLDRASDSRSATESALNLQPAGSGGPYDPANTALGHMTQRQREEGRSPGAPTTGGLTPRIDPSNPNLSERDREAAANVARSRDQAERNALSRTSTGVVSPGNAEALLQGQTSGGKLDLKGPAPEVTQVPSRATMSPAVNEEVRRKAEEKAREDESLERSRQSQTDRKAQVAADKTAASAPAIAPKPAAKRAPARKTAAPAAKKTAARKAR